MEKQAFKLAEANMRSEAIALMSSKKYLKAKESIMLPIDKFLQSIETSTNARINYCNNQVDSIYNKIFMTIAFGISFFILIIFILRKKLLIPIASLSEAITAYELGKELKKPTIYYDDELGLMTKKFYYMKERLDERFEAITQLSLTDPLTQIKNRRAFFELGDDYLRLASRYSHSLSLFILDIDFFKNVNDTYGHIVGDEILKHLVNTIAISLRQTDLFARFGGEEFIVLLPETNLNNAMGVAENIRLLVENTPYESDDLHIPITISIGVNEFTDDKNILELIDSADKALYRAKKNGRNRVES
jgi:diguanylate cyclase (GGDEF)-like protein